MISISNLKNKTKMSQNPREFWWVKFETWNMLRPDYFYVFLYSRADIRTKNLKMSIVMHSRPSTTIARERKKQVKPGKSLVKIKLGLLLLYRQRTRHALIKYGRS